MVVGGEAGFLELARLVVAELAEGDADLHAELRNLADGFEHGFEFAIAFADAFPGGAHTEAGGAVFLGALRDREDLIAGHERLFFESGIVVGALGAVAAILAATAGFHAEQGAKLDFVFRPEFQEHAAAFLDEVEEGAAVGLLELRKGGLHAGVFSGGGRGSQTGRRRGWGQIAPCQAARRGAILQGMFQVVFNGISAGEMAALPKDLQLDLLAEFQFLPGDLDSLDGEKFGKVSRDGRSLLRYRAKDYRIYFERNGEGVLVHRVLHKNTIRDFLFRSNLPMDDEDGSVAKAGDFWKLIREAEEAR